MKKPMFNIGDEIFFMDYATPKKGIIKGIVIVQGVVKTTTFDVKATTDPEDAVIFYHCGDYTLVDERDACSTKQQLINAVFDKIV